jgi:hypothetical protein
MVVLTLFIINVYLAASFMTGGLLYITNLIYYLSFFVIILPVLLDFHELFNLGRLTSLGAVFAKFLFLFSACKRKSYSVRSNNIFMLRGTGTYSLHPFL